jgi:imidazolonepropionase-like amidohydrolase
MNPKLNQFLRTALLVTLFVVAAAGQLAAQVPAPPHKGQTALVGGNLHLMSGAVINNGTILFQDGKIVALGSAVGVPPGATVIDVSGKEVYPGLILGRTTIGLTEIGRITEATDLAETGNINPNVRAQVAFHSPSDHIGVAAVHGVTTAVISPAGGIIAGQPAAMTTDGWTWEQMTLRAPLGITINWPSMGNVAERDKAMQELQDAFDKARRYKLAREADSGANRHPMDVRWEAMLPVLSGELPVFINASDVPQIQAAIAWTEKENLKMILVGGRDAGYMAPQLAKKDIPVMVAPVVGGPSGNWESYDQGYLLPRQLHEAGVRFCIAGEPSAAGSWRLAFHAGAAVAFGLPREEALKAITIYPAQILGIDDLVGSLAPGKDATFIVTDGDPLELWTRTEKVFIQGRQIGETDKHLRLYEMYREKYRQANP